MPRKIIKIIAFILCFLLIFEQSGFAQIAGQLDIALHLSAFSKSLVQDKFRPLHLRYLSYDSLKNNFKLLLDKGDFRSASLRGQKGRNNLNEIASSLESAPGNDGAGSNLEEETKKLLNYFFVGVSLPNENFWVNLRPDSPDKIIDPELAKTEIGKIFLEADLELKKDTANYTNPQTLEGKQYWNKLYQKAEELFGYENITIPTLTRPWIVPGEIIIRETADNAYIYKATLKVMLEQDFLKDSVTYNFTDERSKALNEYSSQLIRELIIPKLTKDINNAKKYAPLRQVYYSLILAQWFKQKYYGKGGLYSWLINKKNLNGLTAKTLYSQDTYFKAYQESFNKGEYNLKESQYTPYGQTMRSYLSGGIAVQDLTSAAVIVESTRRAVSSNNPLENLPVDLLRKGVSASQQNGSLKNPLGDVHVDITAIASATPEEPVGVSLTTAVAPDIGVNPATISELAIKGISSRQNSDRNRVGSTINFGTILKEVREKIAGWFAKKAPAASVSSATLSALAESQPVVTPSGGRFHFEALRLIAPAQELSAEEAERIKAERSNRQEIWALRTVRMNQPGSSWVIEMPLDEIGELQAALGIADSRDLRRLVNTAFSALRELAINKEYDSSVPPEERIDLANLSDKRILIALLDSNSSQHFFEDCRDNGFVGINRSFLEMIRRIAATDPLQAQKIGHVLFTVGLFHELRHEAGMKVDEEDLQAEVRLCVRLMQQEGIEFSILTGAMAAHVHTQGNHFFVALERAVGLPLTPEDSRRLSEEFHLSAQLQNVLGRWHVHAQDFARRIPWHSELSGFLQGDYRLEDCAVFVVDVESAEKGLEIALVDELQAGKVFQDVNGYALWENAAGRHHVPGTPVYLLLAFTRDGRMVQQIGNFSDSDSIAQVDPINGVKRGLQLVRETGLRPTVSLLKKGPQQKHPWFIFEAAWSRKDSSSKPQVGGLLGRWFSALLRKPVTAAARTSPRSNSIGNWMLSLIGAIMFWWGVATQAQPFPAQPTGDEHPIPAETANAPQTNIPGYQAPDTAFTPGTKQETVNSISTAKLAHDSAEYKVMAAFITEHAPEDLRPLFKTYYEGREQGRREWANDKRKLVDYLQQHYRYTGKYEYHFQVIPITGLLKEKGLKVYYDRYVTYQGVIFVDADWYSSSAARQEADSIRNSISSSADWSMLRALGIFLSVCIVIGTTLGMAAIYFSKAISRLRLGLRFWSVLQQKPEIFPERDNNIYLSMTTAGGDTVIISHNESKLINKKGKNLNFGSNSSNELTAAAIAGAARFLLDKQGLRTFKRVSNELRQAKIARNTTLLLLIKMLAEGEDVQNVDDFLLRALWFKEKLGYSDAARAYAMAYNSPEVAVWLCVIALARYQVAMSDSIVLPGEILRLIRSTKPADYQSFVPTLVNLLADRALTTSSQSEKALINVLLKNILFDLKNYYIEFNPEKKDGNLYMKDMQQEVQEEVVRKIVELIAVSTNAQDKAEFLAPYLGQMRVFPFMQEALLALKSPLINLVSLLDNVTAKVAMHKRMYLFGLLSLKPGEIQAMRMLSIAHAKEFVDAVELWVKHKDEPEQNNADLRKVKQEAFLLILNLSKNYSNMFILLRNFLKQIENDINTFEVIPTQEFVDFIMQGILVPMSIDREGKKYEYTKDATTLGILLSVLAAKPKNAVEIADGMGQKISYGGAPAWIIEQALLRFRQNEPMPSLVMLMRIFNPALVPHAAALEAMHLTISGPLARDLFEGKINQVVLACVDSGGKIDEYQFMRAVMESTTASKETKESIKEQGLGRIIPLSASSRDELRAERQHITDLAAVYNITYEQMLEAIIFYGNLRKLIPREGITVSTLNFYIQVANSPDAGETLALINDLLGYGYRYDVVHLSGLAGFARQRTRVIADIEEVRQITPNFIYNPQSAGNIFDPFEQYACNLFGNTEDLKAHKNSLGNNKIFKGVIQHYLSRLDSSIREVVVNLTYGELVKEQDVDKRVEAVTFLVRRGKDLVQALNAFQRRGIICSGDIMETLFKKRDISFVDIAEETEDMLESASKPAQAIVKKILNISGRRYESVRDGLAIFVQAYGMVRGARLDEKPFVRDAGYIVGRYVIGKIGHKQFLSDLEDLFAEYVHKALSVVLEGAVPSYFVEFLETNPQVMRRLAVLIGVYFHIQGENPDTCAKIRTTLKELVKLKDAQKLNVWLFTEAEWNKPVYAALTQKGYSSLLWTQGFSKTLPTDAPGKDETKLRAQTEQLIDFVKKNKLEYDQSIATLDTYKDALAFAEKYILNNPAIPETEQQSIRSILIETERLEREYQKKYAPTNVRVEIGFDFFKDSASGVGVPGCYNPLTGAHRQMPLMHALEADVLFLRVYRADIMIANAVLVLTEHGVVVQPLYNSKNLDLQGVIFDALADLVIKGWIPAVLLQENPDPTFNSAGFSVGKTFSRKFEATPDGKLPPEANPAKAKILTDTYYFDFGSVSGFATQYIFDQATLRDKNYTPMQGIREIAPEEVKAQPQDIQNDTSLTKEERSQISKELFNLGLNIDLKPVLQKLDKIIFEYIKTQLEEILAGLKTRAPPGAKPSSEDIKVLRDKLLEFIDKLAVEIPDNVEDVTAFQYAASKTIHTHLHGLYVRSSDGRTIYTNRTELEARLQDHLQRGEFARFLGKPDFTIYEVLRFIDGHETFHALIDELRRRGIIIEMTQEKEEELADLFGRDFALGSALLDIKLREQLARLSRILKVDVAKIIRKHQTLEKTLEEFGITVQVDTTKTSQELQKIKDQIQNQDGALVRAMKGDIKPPAEAMQQMEQFLAATQRGTAGQGGYQTGALVDLRSLSADKEVIIVGDAHARLDNINMILEHNGNREKILKGQAVLIILGDALHPELNSLEGQEFMRLIAVGDDEQAAVLMQKALSRMQASIATMQLLMDLKIQSPQNVYWVLGDHEYPTDEYYKGDKKIGVRVYQGAMFREALINSYGQEFVRKYEEFIQAGALAVVCNGAVAVHGGPAVGVNLDTMRHLDPSQLFTAVNYQLMLGRHGGKEGFNQEQIDIFLAAMGQPNGILISGHDPQEGEHWHWNITPNYQIVFAAHERVGYAVVQNGQANFLEVTDPALLDKIVITPEEWAKTGANRKRPDGYESIQAAVEEAKALGVDYKQLNINWERWNSFVDKVVGAQAAGLTKREAIAMAAMSRVVNHMLRLLIVEKKQSLVANDRGDDISASIKFGAVLKVGDRFESSGGDTLRIIIRIEGDQLWTITFKSGRVSFENNLSLINFLEMVKKGTGKVFRISASRSLVGDNITMISSEEFRNIANAESFGGPGREGGFVQVNGIMTRDGQILAFGNIQDLRGIRGLDVEEGLKNGLLFEFGIKYKLPIVSFDTKSPSYALSNVSNGYSRSVPLWAVQNLATAINIINEQKVAGSQARVASVALDIDLMRRLIAQSGLESWAAIASFIISKLPVARNYVALRSLLEQISTGSLDSQFIGVAVEEVNQFITQQNLPVEQAKILGLAMGINWSQGEGESKQQPPSSAAALVALDMEQVKGYAEEGNVEMLINDLLIGMQGATAKQITDRIIRIWESLPADNKELFLTKLKENSIPVPGSLTQGTSAAGEATITEELLSSREFDNVVLRGKKPLAPFSLVSGKKLRATIEEKEFEHLISQGAPHEVIVDNTPFALALGPCIGVIIHHTQTKKTYVAHSQGQNLDNLEQMIVVASQDAELTQDLAHVKVVIAGAEVLPEHEMLDAKDTLQSALETLRNREYIVSLLQKSGFQVIHQVFTGQVGVGVDIEFDTAASVCYPTLTLDDSSRNENIKHFVKRLEAKSKAEPSAAGAVSFAAPGLPPKNTRLSPMNHDWEGALSAENPATGSSEPNILFVKVRDKASGQERYVQGTVRRLSALSRKEKPLVARALFDMINRDSVHSLAIRSFADELSRGGSLGMDVFALTETRADGSWLIYSLLGFHDSTGQRTIVLWVRPPNTNSTTVQLAGHQLLAYAIADALQSNRTVRINMALTERAKKYLRSGTNGPEVMKKFLAAHHEDLRRVAQHDSSIGVPQARQAQEASSPKDGMAVSSGPVAAPDANTLRNLIAQAGLESWAAIARFILDRLPTTNDYAVLRSLLEQISTNNLSFKFVGASVTEVNSFIAQQNLPAEQAKILGLAMGVNWSQGEGGGESKQQPLTSTAPPEQIAHKIDSPFGSVLIQISGDGVIYIVINDKQGHRARYKSNKPLLSSVESNRALLQIARVVERDIEIRGRKSIVSIWPAGFALHREKVSFTLEGKKQDLNTQTHEEAHLEFAGWMDEIVTQGKSKGEFIQRVRDRLKRARVWSSIVGWQLEYYGIGEFIHQNTPEFTALEQRLQGAREQAIKGDFNPDQFLEEVRIKLGHDVAETLIIGLLSEVYARASGDIAEQENPFNPVGLWQKAKDAIIRGVQDMDIPSMPSLLPVQVEQSSAAGAVPPAVGLSAGNPASTSAGGPVTTVDIGKKEATLPSALSTPESARAKILRMLNEFGMATTPEEKQVVLEMYQQAINRFVELIQVLWTKGIVYEDTVIKLKNVSLSGSVLLGQPRLGIHPLSQDYLGAILAEAEAKRGHSSRLINLPSDVDVAVEFSGSMPILLSEIKRICEIVFNEMGVCLSPNILLPGYVTIPIESAQGNGLIELVSERLGKSLSEPASIVSASDSVSKNDDKKGPPAAGAAETGLEAPAASAAGADNPGGINFIALPIVVQPVKNLGALPLNISDSLVQRQSPAKTVPSLEKEWQRIVQTLNGGIIPSNERIKEHILNICANGNCAQEFDKVLSCIADILRLEEERCSPTAPALRDILILLESDKSVQEVQLALAKVNVEEKMPEVVTE